MAVFNMVKIPNIFCTWGGGTDEQIVSLIHKARAGMINLQQDAGWAVGDIRTIEISAFVGGGDVQHKTQTVDLIITSFDEYENCGNVLQFDFKEPLLLGNRMHSSLVKYYSYSEMYTTTLPNLVDALPEWLQSLLIDFSVKANTSTYNESVEIIPNNKLALRSAIEVGVKTNGIYALEGQQIAYYTQLTRRKHQWWWTRSRQDGDQSYWIYVNVDGNSTNNGPTASIGLVPFGCI